MQRSVSLATRLEPRARYLVKSLQKQLERSGRACPNCGDAGSSLVSRKHLVTELRRCGRCRLMFRAPTTTSEESEQFYQSRYQQGFTTEMPDDATLAALLGTRFAGTGKDFARHLALLSALGVEPGARLVDFGCSWGYGSWQFAEAGYRVQAYEVSAPRRHFARDKLGVDAVDDPALAGGPFDVFFSCHVLEHVPSIADVVATARRVLRPGGLFVAFTPNGSLPQRTANRDWRKSWGLVHPSLLDDVFYLHTFAREPLWLGSSPPDLAALGAWAARNDRPAREVHGLSGGELLCVARLGET